jgi:hypothetical protein
VANATWSFLEKTLLSPPDIFLPSGQGFLVWVLWTDGEKRVLTEFGKQDTLQIKESDGSQFNFL